MGMSEFLLGVNYWPATRGVHWWEEFHLREAEEDLALVRHLGLNCVRLFLRWRDFQPAPDRVDPAALANLDAVIAAAMRLDLKLILTLFTGHMSGENWDVPWRHGRSPYTDPDLLREQLRLANQLARRYGQHPAVAAWDLANEHDNFAPLPHSSAGWLWTHLLTREFELYARQPAILGTHITSFTERDCFRYSDLGELQSVLCVHPYPIYTPLCPGPSSRLPSALFPSFCAKLAAALGGRPVLMEEFGLSTYLASEEEAEAYFRTTLFSSLAAGCTGALAWCFADFTCTSRLPYCTVPHEAGFGITQAGRPKRTGEAMADFAAVLSRFPWKDLTPQPCRAAVLLPSRYYDHPELPPTQLFATLFAAYVSAKQAGLDVEFVSPGSPLERYLLLIIPSLPLRGSLEVSHWEEVKQFVVQGGCFYLSTDGAALPGLEEVFGVRLLYPEVTAWPALPGETLPRRRTVVEPQGARVIEHAGDGYPLVLEHRYGRGRALLVTEPLERLLAAAPWHLATNRFYRFYRRAADLAGLDPDAWGADLRPAKPPCRAVRTFCPRVSGEAKIFASDRGEHPPHLVLVSHDHRMSFWPNPGGHRWRDLATDELFSGRVPLNSHQGRLLRLEPP
jgi:beta-galactosidase